MQNSILRTLRCHMAQLRSFAAEASTSSSQIVGPEISTPRTPAWLRGDMGFGELLMEINSRVQSKGQYLVSGTALRALCSKIQTPEEAAAALGALEAAWVRKASSKKGGRLAIRPWATDYGITQTFVDRCLAVGAQNQALVALQKAVVLGLPWDKSAYEAFVKDAVARSDASALAGAWFAVTFNSRPDSRVVEMVSKGLESCGRTELASVVLQEAASNGVEGVGGGSGSEQES